MTTLGNMVGWSIPPTEALQITFQGDEIRMLGHALYLLVCVKLGDLSLEDIRNVEAEIRDWPEAYTSVFDKVAPALIETTTRIMSQPPKGGA